MAFNEILAGRVRSKLNLDTAVVEKKMFDGIGFLIQGNMACSVNQDNLIVRNGPEMYHSSLVQEYVSEFEIKG